MEVSMWKAAGHRIIVKPDDPPEKIGSVFVPAWVRDNKAFEIIKGTIVDVGPKAWKAFDDGRPWAKIGDRVMFAKYGGSIIEDEETHEKYRLMNDEDVVGIYIDNK
jgi:co-chaperonin GroES (HSP10)